MGSSLLCRSRDPEKLTMGIAEVLSDKKDEILKIAARQSVDKA
jgi:hypothetical protein